MGRPVPQKMQLLGPLGTITTDWLPLLRLALLLVVWFLRLMVSTPR
ncbi:hypothetical protein AB0M80_05640 [Amycolatopsis sp. NPDC051045]